MRVVLLGLPPSTNNLYAVVMGRQILTETGRAYHRAVAAVMRKAWQQPPSPSPFAVMITYHVRYDRDVDGSQKVLLDGFAPKLEKNKVPSEEQSSSRQEPIVWNDDRQLVLFAARKVRVKAGVLPYVSVIIRELVSQPAFVAPHVPALRGDRRRLDFGTDLIPPSNNNAYTVSRGRHKATGVVTVGASGAISKEKPMYGRVKTREARLVADAFGESFGYLASELRQAALTDGSSSRAAEIAADTMPFPAAVRLRLRFGYTADRRDVDGSSKILLDAARGTLWGDDAQITSYSVAKARVPAGAVACIEGGVWEIG